MTTMLQTTGKAIPNLSKLTENGYREQFYALKGETAVLRDDDRHGHRSEGRVGYARARQLDLTASTCF